MSNSIVARLGIDSKNMLRDLEGAATSAEKGGQKIGEKFKQGFDKKGAILKGATEVAGQIRSFAQNLAAGGTAADALSAALGSMSQSLNLSIGKLAALGVAAIAVEKLHNLRTETLALKVEIDALNQPQGSVEYASLGDLQARLDSIRTTAKKAAAALDSPLKTAIANIAAHPMQTAIDIVASPFTKAARDNLAHGAADSAGDQQATASRAAQEAADRIGEKKQKANELSKAGLTLGERAVELAKIEQEKNEAIGAALKLQNDAARDGVAIDASKIIGAAKEAAALKVSALYQKDAEASEKAVVQLSFIEAELRDHSQIAKALQTVAGFEEKIRAARESGNTALVQILTEQQAITLELQAQQSIESARAKTQMSIGELAKAKGVGVAAHDAKNVLSLEARAKKARGLGQKDKADALQQRAEASVTSLQSAAQSQNKATN